MKKRIKRWHENHLIKVILNEGWFPLNSINQGEKKIDTGMYGLYYSLCGPRTKNAIAMLQRWHGYRCFEQRYKLWTLA
jgi:hypothetical protein